MDYINNFKKYKKILFEINLCINIVFIFFKKRQRDIADKVTLEKI